MRYSVIGGTLQQVRGVGATVIRDAPNVKIIFADLTESQAAQLKAKGCIVQEVASVRTAVTPPKPVAASPVYTAEDVIFATGFHGYRELLDPPLYGRGFTVAVLDTGIRETHEQIKDRVVLSKNYTSGLMRDGFDHGTACASVILAIAPECGLLNFKVLDDEGNGTEEEVVLAIDDCLALHNEKSELTPLVINISLGSEDDGNPDSPMRVACRAAIAKGIWVAAAAGNGGADSGTILSPACEQYVFAIGSCKLDPFMVSSWSSRGPTKEGLIKPDILGVGQDLSLASSASDTATAAKSGTSFACPFMTGVGVLYHEGFMHVTYIGPPFESSWTGRFPELEELEMPPDADVIIDKYLGQICVKPQGIPLAKDNDYGYGVIAGDLVSRMLGARPAGIDISALLMPILMIGMLGMVIKVMK